MDSSNDHYQAIRKFNPRLIVLNSATSPFVNNKYFTNILFDTDDLKPFKPRFVLCKKKYHKELAAKVIQAIPCSRYVIKPLNEFKGRGVIIVDADNLDKTLYKILYINGIKKRGQHAHSKYETYGHWKRDKHNYFLIEEWCPSKTIVLKGKPYDPTLRVAFIIAYNQGNIDLHYLGAYWKIPLYSLKDKVKLTKCHKSWGLSPARVSDDDLAQVYALLDQCLPKVYMKMINLINAQT
jgi:hypothetical protein